MGMCRVVGCCHNDGTGDNKHVPYSHLLLGSRVEVVPVLSWHVKSTGAGAGRLSLIDGGGKGNAES